MRVWWGMDLWNPFPGTVGLDIFRERYLRIPMPLHHLGGFERGEIKRHSQDERMG